LFKVTDIQAFVDAQNAIVEDYLAKYPHTDAFRERFFASPSVLTRSLTKKTDHERGGAPFRRGNRWYHNYNEGLKPHWVLNAIEGDAIDSDKHGTLFFDPNELSDDGSISVSPIHTLLNYV
jgi:prolyl oligopeptidase